jgi:elongation factor G
MAVDIHKIRNIGISAHIDSGKTTLTERILFYTNRIHAIHDVKGKDGVGAKMDSMELERERGITIQSAATYCEWDGKHVNIIDTPGHVDFTIEVERALRVLDGAVLVLCSVGGVQSQTITVDRQMRRYNVPRIAFINKCDRSGANPRRVTQQLREKLNHNAVMLQLPIGLENDFRGVIDLVEMKAAYFDGENGEIIRYEEIPADMVDEAQEARDVMLDAVSMCDDALMEAMLEENVTLDMVRAAIRKGVLDLKLIPVMIGSAYKNKAVQLLLNGVSMYLPDPTEVPNRYIDIKTEEERPVKSSKDEPLLMLAFKLEDGRYGQLTYVRIYQGELRKGQDVYNMRTGRKVKVGRLLRMHSDDKEDIEAAAAGDIVALFGVDCASGDTFTDGDFQATMTSMYIPEPVIKLTIKPTDNKTQVNMSKALQRFTREDPTFRVELDPETNETIISGMGELHLEVYVERMRREYKAEVETGQPQVAYRETIMQRAEFNYTHKKQTGGSGQYGNVVGFVEPLEGKDFEFETRVTGGNIPTEYIPSVEKGMKTAIAKGSLIGFPVTNVKVVLEDGKYHPVDSSDMAFQSAAIGAFRQVYPKAQPTILEPLMQRRGRIMGTNDDGGFTVIQAEVPLNEMFGYSTVLRSGTQGKAEFSMEFAKYAPVPNEVSLELRKKFADQARMAIDE